MAQLKGIDIASFQHPSGKAIDFKAVKASGIDFVIIKATESTDYANPYYRQDVIDARNAGLLIGHYHFARPEEGHTALEEANYFLSITGDNLQNGDVLALDWEPNWQGDADTYAVTWLDRVSAQRNGIKPIIYMNKSTQKGHSWAKVVAGGYGLWLADYENTGTDAPFSVTAFQQTSNAGKISGISATTDTNIFYGDVNAFKAYGYKAPANGAGTDTRDQQIADLTKQVTDLNSTIKTLSQNNVDLQNSIEALKEEGLQKDKKITSLNDGLTGAKNQLKITEDKANTDKENYDKQILDKDTFIKQLQVELKKTKEAWDSETVQNVSTQELISIIISRTIPTFKEYITTILSKITKK